MTAHTPGKWGFDDEWVFSDSHLAGKGDIVCLSPALEGFEHSAKRWEANARLIAAAPELLAVAQHSATALRLSGVEANAHSDNPIEWLLHQTEAAIAKAKGEQP